VKNLAQLRHARDSPFRPRFRLTRGVLFFGNKPLQEIPMTKTMRPTSILMSVDALNELRKLALTESLRSGQTVSTSSLVRRIIDDFLAGRKLSAEDAQLSN
jgi:hypothetical protein